MEVKDEYAGLMTNREKQWLLNIQMLQLNTGTPYFDDYYYTVFKERKAKNNKENFPNERNHRYQNNRQQRNNERQDNNNTLTPRVYTPLQFENSLGKLQVSESVGSWVLNLYYTQDVFLILASKLVLKSRL